MKKYSDSQLEENYNKFISGIQNVFTGERLEKLLHMYSMDELGPNLMISPASGNIGYHNAYEGGYIDHIMNVVKTSVKMKDLYESIGGVIDFTMDELLFCAFQHDLGKLGEKDNVHYVPNPSDWHVKNQGKLYVPNPKLSFMDITDKTFFLLNQYQVSYNEKEFFGIQLTDGMYDDANIKYLKPYTTDKQLRSNIQFVMHWADHASTCMERDFQFKKPF